MKTNYRLFLTLLFVTVAVACQATTPNPTPASPTATFPLSPVFQSPLPMTSSFDKPRILFALPRDGVTDWYTMNPDGSDIARLEFQNLKGFQVSDFKWVSQLKAFVVVLTDEAGRDDLYLIDVQGSVLRRLTSTPDVKKGDPSYSSVDQQFVFVCAEQDLDVCVVSADGTGYLNLTNYYSRDAQPEWSPSGQRIIFVSNKSGVPDIYGVDRDGSSMENLSHTGEPNGAPGWSPDGRKIVFNSQRDYNWEIYVMDADGGHPINLTNNPGTDMDPKWSPDGQYIAFRSDRSGNQHIYVMKTDGSNVVDVTNVPGADVYNYLWSLDGQEVYFQLDMADESSIYVVNRDGTNPRKLTDGVAPQWVGN